MQVASGRDVFAMALAELELPEAGEWPATNTAETQVESVDEASTALDESINQSFGVSESSAIDTTEADGEVDDEEEQPTTSQGTVQHVKKRVKVISLQLTTKRMTSAFK